MMDKIVFDHPFDRIRELYGLSSDAALARLLMIAPQDIPRFRKGKTLPYKQILHTCHAKDWEFIFLGGKTPEPQDRTITFEKAMEYLSSLGYRVTLEKRD